MGDLAEVVEAEAPAADAQPATTGRDPESAAWFRAKLAEVGHTKGSLSRLMKNCGDPRERKAILRSLERMSSGDARVSAEMHVLLHFLTKSRAKRARQEAAGRQEEPAMPPT
jgi:hypothetical protein